MIFVSASLFSAPLFDSLCEYTCWIITFNDGSRLLWLSILWLILEFITRLIARKNKTPRADPRLAMKEGFEGYQVDFRRGFVTYYAPETCIDLPIHALENPVAHQFDTAAVRAAIGAAQSLAPGYTYLGFCNKIAAAGSAESIEPVPWSPVRLLSQTLRPWRSATSRRCHHRW